MTATMARPQFYESGTTARRLQISVTRLHELGHQLGLPAVRSDSGRRLWTEQEMETIRRLREERQAARAAGRELQTA